MKTFGRYLWYRLENSALRTLIITILSVILSQSVISEQIEDHSVEYIRYIDSGIYILAIVLGIVFTLIPILETTCFKNRRNLDTLYFFPIKREKLALVHYLAGLIEATFIYTVTFVAAHILLAVRTDFFALSYMPLYFFLSLLLGIVIYSFVIFIFGQANTVADGVVMTILWIFAIALTVYAINTFLEPIYMQDMQENFQTYLLRKRLSILPEWGILYAPINNLTVIFQSLIEANQSSWNEFEYAKLYLEQFYFFIIWGLIGIACTVGYFITFVKKGAHKAGEITSSYFGYRLLIPLYGYSLLIMIGSLEIITVLVFMMMIIGYIIYRRGFKLRASDLVVTALGTIPLLLGML